MYKLINLGMDKRLWSVIYDSYNGFKCSVKIAGGLSNRFCPQQVMSCLCTFFAYTTMPC